MGIRSSTSLNTKLRHSGRLRQAVAVSAVHSIQYTKEHPANVESSGAAIYMSLDLCLDGRYVRSSSFRLLMNWGDRRRCRGATWPHFVVDAVLNRPDEFAGKRVNIAYEECPALIIEIVYFSSSMHTIHSGRRFRRPHRARTVQYPEDNRLEHLK
ncbi:hypothetical protein LshimejAT787_2100200 [Lyophyllum shimeji]|uniref:Uncharacterized protein n=1 Tax=Lyophyllum shimeji TaxID=47721 RepID=A0A9P3Q0A2_LYOSH|nr:hypothetical protein LshimejAT787_2100200 [Lyophyllum shimeji]